jgi:RHS repeat-associated protein
VAGHVVGYVNSHEAIISSSSGRRKLAFSSVPLVTSMAGSVPAPVDLALRKAADGLAPRNPLEPLLIGSRLDEGVSVGSGGLRLTLQGADVAARRVGASTAFFANVATDTDAEVVPTATGVEMSVTLRSPRSPELLRYVVALPRGASLRPTSGDLPEVVRDGKVLAVISAPVAVDAQGSSVPVSFSVVGDSLMVRVAHRQGDFAYPILLDPQVSMSPDGGAWSEYGPHLGYDQNAFGNQDPYDITANPGTWGSDVVQWTWLSSNSVTASAVDNPVQWTLYDVNMGSEDTNNTESAGIYIGMCNDNPSDGILSAAHGQMLEHQQYSFWAYTNGCSQVTPVFQNEVYTGGTANGPTWSSFGSFLITFTCVSSCAGVETPSGSVGWGDGNPAGPYAPQADCGDWPVNCANGNQFEAQTDLSIPGRGLGLALARTYNSLAAEQGITGPFGAGWSSSYSDSLTIDQSAETATVTQANGSTVPFTISGSTFEAPSWVHATLVQNGDGTYTYTLANQDSYHFDSNGRLLSERDRNGETTTCSYDSQGRLTTITDPAGRTITLSYTSDTEGNVASATDSSGRTVYYTYSDGNLATVTDATGAEWQFGYNSLHELTSETDPRGNTVTTGYNAAGEVSSQTDPANRTRTWTYSSGETAIQNPDGSQTDEYFNGLLPTSITYAAGTSVAATTTFAYDEDDDLAAVTDPGGNVTSYVYDSSGNLIRETDPLDRETKWTYDALNDVTSMTDPMGVTTSYTYDSHGNLLSASTPLAGTDQTQTTTFTRGDSSHLGDITATTDPNGKTTSYTYDSDGDLASVTDPLGNETTYGYDSVGDRTSMISPRGNVSGANPASFTTTYSYDSDGRLTSETDPLGHTQQWSYDGDGNLISYTDADSNATAYTYDPDNELTKVTRADSTTLQNTYNSAGSLTSQTNGNAQTTSYAYDALERLSSITDPLSRETSYAYNSDGELSSVTDPTSRVTSYDYDADKELTSISYSDGQTPNVSYAYNADGERTSMSDGTGTSSFSYDSLGRLTSQTDGAGQSVSYGYDLDGNPTSITYPNGQAVTRTFDDDDRLSSVADWLGNTISFSYDPDSDLTATTFPSGTDDVDGYSYDDADQLASIAMTQGSSTLASLAYTRDPAGLITNQTQTGLPGPSSANYSYTPLNQLSIAGSENYSYDSADDITELDGNSGYSYDHANELTGSPTATYAYNELGERTSATPTDDSATAYAYDQAGRLTTYTPPTGTGSSYSYDGDGLLATASANSANFVWDQTSQLPLLLSDGQNSYIYGPDNVPIEQINSSGNVTYLHHDQLGSTTLLTGSNGDPTATFTYSPYGALTGSTGTATTPLGYAGQYTDPTSGLIYMQDRWYDPTTGQFISVDPLEAQTGQPYSYADDDPINETDPSGLFSLDDLNPIYDYEQEIQDYENGGSYLGSVMHGVEGAVIGTAEVGVSELAGAAGEATDADIVAITDDEAENGQLDENALECSAAEDGVDLSGATTASGRFPSSAEPDEILVRRDPLTGEPTNYQEYGPDGLPTKRVDLTGSDHGGIETPHVHDYGRNTDPATGETFVNPGPVRPANPSEIP